MIQYVYSVLLYVLVRTILTIPKKKTDAASSNLCQVATLVAFLVVFVEGACQVWLGCLRMAAAAATSNGV